MPQGFRHDSGGVCLRVAGDIFLNQRTARRQAAHEPQSSVRAPVVHRMELPGHADGSGRRECERGVERNSTFVIMAVAARGCICLLFHKRLVIPHEPSRIDYE